MQPCKLVLSAVLILVVPPLVGGRRVGAAETTPGERLDPATHGPGVIETMADVLAREESLRAVQPGDPEARDGRPGTWVVPSRRATYFPLSGRHNVVNKWGDTCMGIGFPEVVTVQGAFFAGQAGRGAWTPAVRAIGYRNGREIARTSWFRGLDDVPRWFQMDLHDVDRIVIESLPVLQGGGWYGMDDLTFMVRRGEDATNVETVVVDFDDLPFNTTLSRDGPGYAGLYWESGSGDFEANQIIHHPRSPRPAQQEAPVPGREGDAPAAQVGGRAPDLKFEFQGVIRGDAGVFSAPPDTCGAVGPNDFVETVNAVFAVYDKRTGERLFATTLAAFLPGSSGDPRVLFDQHSDRWVIIASDFSSRIYLAVSMSSDPLGPWFKTSILAAQGSDEEKWPDYPTLGVDANGIYVSAYMVGGTNRMTVFAFEKAPLIDPQPALGTVTAFRELPWEGAIQPAHTYGSPPGEYLVSRVPISSIRVRRVDPPLDAPTLTEVAMVSVPDFFGPPDAPALGSQTPLDTVGDRLMMAVYRDGSIWTAHTVGLNSRAAARWYQIDAAAGELVQSGTVADDFLNYFFPSITVNRFGDVAMGFTGSEATQYAGAYFTGRGATDPPGAMPTPILLHPGSAAQNIIDGFGRNRWGDYSLTSLDPEDEETIWTLQEYAHGPNIWGTWGAALGFGDCDGDGVRDECEIDCGSPGGECDVPGCGTESDCNGNGIPDACEIDENSSAPGGPFFCRSACDPDCNADGVPDSCQALPDCNGNGHADACDVAGITYSEMSPLLAPFGGDFPQNYEIMNPPPADSDVTLSFQVIADLGLPSEWIDVFLNGTNVGSLFRDDGTFCASTPDRGEIVVPQETYNSMLVFGTLSIAMVPNAGVNADLCSPTSSVRVTVAYTIQSRDVNQDGIPDECEHCDDDAMCPNNVCTASQCIDGLCFSTSLLYGDLAGEGGTCGGDGQVDVFDIFAVLDGFQERFADGCSLADIDIAGTQGGCIPDGSIDVFDIFAVLDAFQGIDDCCGAVP